MKLMTNEEYCNCSGLSCPYCKSSGIQTVDRVQTDYDIASQYIKCISCGKHWTDIYKLMGFDEDPEENE